jgi:cysteine synthase A
MKIYHNITEVIGHTPLLRLNHLPQEMGCVAEIVLKMEGMNPAKSVKDRIAISMITEAEQAGLIQPHHSTIVEATSGNTGIGLAMVCAVKGYRLILTMPDNMSAERQKLLQAYGAEVFLTPAISDMQGAIAHANQLLMTIPKAFSPHQFSNPANPKIHYHTTGAEIWEDTDGVIAALVVGVGTGGTLTGAGCYLKQRNPQMQIIAVEPSDSAVLSGQPAHQHNIQGIGAGFIPDVLRVDLIDEIAIVTEAEAYETGKQLAQKEGILSGISTGAVVYAGLQIGRRSQYQNQRIVIVQPSAGERYLSTTMWNDGGTICL